MKNKLLSLISFSVLTLFLSSTIVAQVGIGTTDPKTTLDVDGALSLREGTALSLSNGSNINIDLGTTPYSSYRITDPTTAFEIGSIVPETGADGQIVTFINTTDQDMTIVHTGAGGAYRIFCPKETNIVLSGRYTTATFQYNLGISKWMLINSMGTNASDDWTTSGNVGTTAGADFLGTTDNQALSIFTNNTEKLRISENGHFRSFTDGTTTLPMFSWDADRDTGFYRIGDDILGFTTGGSERMRILDDGRVSINNNSPFVVDLLTSTAATDNYAINGYSSGTGVGVYGENTGTGYGVWGNAANIGVYGSGGIGTYGDANNATGYGMRARNTNALGTGLLASGTNSPATYLTSGTGIASNGVDGLFSYARTSSGTGVIATGNNNANIYTLVNGSGSASTGTEIGVFGIATTTTVDGSGGYFTNDGSYAYVGGWINTGPPFGWVAYKIIGPGTVSTIIKNENEKPVVMFAPEAPEILFQDYGIGKLSNGVSNIIIDPTLSKNIRVDAQHPLKVFIQLEGDCNGVYVTNKSANGFTVKELQGGSSNVEFAWSIVATRANEEIIGKDGSTRVSNNSVRFPNAPLPMDKKAVKTITQKKPDLKTSKNKI